MPNPDSPTRLRYLDWTRGVAALIMLQGHTFHSFTRVNLHETGPYVLSQYLGGIAPAIFLFAPVFLYAVDARFEKVALRPDSPWSEVWRWRVRPGQEAARDRE